MAAAPRPQACSVQEPIICLNVIGQLSADPNNLDSYFSNLQSLSCLSSIISFHNLKIDFYSTAQR